MNKKIGILITSLFLLTIILCVQTRKQKNYVLADYKSDTYRIALGDNYKVSSKTIDWRWAALNDPDGSIDSTGINSFLYLGEPLIEYNQQTLLPALFIETNKSLITEFVCSISFSLEDKKNAIADFLSLISKDFKKLQVDSIKNIIAQNGSYEIITESYIETYELTKKSKESVYDNFKYTIRINDKNGSLKHETKMTKKRITINHGNNQ
jgi:hypothetical protein